MKEVYLSPSTQEKNIGVAGYGTEERYANDICDRVALILSNAGVKYKRNAPTMTLKEVVVDSNSQPYALHVAIHTNAMGGASSGKARGCEVFVHTKTSPSMPFASNLYKRISDITPVADRGIKEGIHHLAGGKPLYELAYTNAPSCLIEIAFHDNEADVLWLLGHKDDIAAAIAASILDYLGVPKVTALEHSLYVVNDAFRSKGVAELGVPYWKQNAVPGGACNGEYVAMVLRRMEEYLKK